MIETGVNLYNPWCTVSFTSPTYFLKAHTLKSKKLRLIEILSHQNMIFDPAYRLEYIGPNYGNWSKSSQYTNYSTNSGILSMNLQLNLQDLICTQKLISSYRN